MAAEYQSTVKPVAGFAETVTTPVPHLEEATAAGTAGTAFTVAITELRDDETHADEVVFAST